MSQVQVGFGAIVCHEYFSVLDRVHGAGVNVDVGVEFLHGYFVTSCFQQSAKGCGCDSFAKAGDNAACNKYVLDWHSGDTSF